MFKDHEGKAQQRHRAPEAHLILYLAGYDALPVGVGQVSLQPAVLLGHRSSHGKAGVPDSLHTNTLQPGLVTYPF